MTGEEHKRELPSVQQQPLTGGSVSSAPADATLELLELLRTQPLRVARYEVREEVGRGGMGTVLRVFDRELKRRVAMKVLDGMIPSTVDPGIAADRTRRFLEEAQVTGQLDHPGIVPVHELGLDDRGRLFFTMKLVRGRTFAEVLDLLHERREGWTQTKALGVLLKVCEALAFAHDRGVIHRDLKPANVMVGPFGETYVMDWGLARVLHQPAEEVKSLPGASSVSGVHTVRDEPAAPGSPLVTADGRVIGTPAFMAPEQAEGRVDDMSPRTDIYAVGAILYEVLAGEAPYVPAGANLSPRTILARVLAGPPRPIEEINPQAPPDLVAVCRKAMARDAAWRYATTLELAADIEAFLDRRPVRAQRPGVWHAVGLAIARNRAVVVTVGVAAVALLLVATWFVVESRSAAREQEQLGDFLAIQGLIDTHRDLCSLLPEEESATVRWLQRAVDLLGRWANGPDAWKTPTSSLLSAAEKDALFRNVNVVADLRRRVAAELKRARGLDAITVGSPAAHAVWQRFFDDIGRDPQFARLPHTPQRGLVPLDRNPQGYWEFWHVLSGERPVRAARGDYQIQPETGVVLVLLPGGEFVMGPHPALVESGATLPAHEKRCPVTLAPFLLGKWEVTQAQWLRETGENPSLKRAGLVDDVTYTSLHPVESIPWEPAARFARRLGLALPNEAQLEYAARALQYDAPTFWGNANDALRGKENVADASLEARLPENPAAPWNDGFPFHAPVASFAANGFGLYDTVGNVSEWCANEFSVDYATATRPMPDLTAAMGVAFRCVRGASWGTRLSQARASLRMGFHPLYCTHWVGVRLAKEWRDR